MKKKKKSKGNPNLLSWIQDIISNPLKEAVKYVILHREEVLHTLNPVSVIHDAVKTITPAVVTVEKKLKPATLKSITDAAALKPDLIAEADGSLEAITAVIMGIEAGSLGMVDVTPDRAAQLPVFRFLNEIAVQPRLIEFSEGFVPLYQRHLRKQYTPLLPEPHRLADMATKGILPVKDYNYFMAQNGLAEQHADNWREAQYLYPNLTEAFRCNWRGVLDDEGLTYWMQRMGYQPTLIEQLKKLKEKLVPPEVMAVAMQKEWITDDEYNKVMARYGYNVEEAKWLYHTNEKIPDLGTLYNLKWRGLIDEGTFDTVMKDAMFPGWLVEPLKELATVIPPLPDMITMAVREAFGEHTYEEQMPALLEWGAKMGLSKDWVERYWYAHWERIALREMYSNLWRGYWTKEEFMRMLRIKDVHPDDREAIYNVAFLPPSIREMGYGYDMGVYTRDDIVRYRRWGGMSPVDAEKAADSLIRYRTSAEIEAVRREWLWSYAHGKIDKATYMNELKNLDTPDEALEYWFKRGELQLERFKKPTPIDEGRIVSSSEAKWAYKKGLRDETWLRSTLAELDWTPERIDLAVDRANLEIEAAKADPVPIQYRNLTMTQIRDLYRFSKLSEAEIEPAFQKIGYSEKDASMLSQILIASEVTVETPRQLSRTDVARFYDMGIYSIVQVYDAYLDMGYTTEDSQGLALYTAVNIEFPDLRAMYRNGWISAEVMYNELVNIGLSPDRASELMMTVVKAEQPARLAAERDLTKSEIIKGVKAELITPLQARDILMDMGYDEAEALFILAINKVIEAGDPEGYWDMRRVVEQFKKARGEKAIEIPEALLILEQAIKQQKAQIESLKKEKAKEEDISTAVLALSRLEQQMVMLIKELKLA